MTKVTYIDHSGFLLETENASFLFDYYKGLIPTVNPDKPFLVFVSHKHSDHYNPEIFELIKSYPNIRYILSKDIPTKWLFQKYKEQGVSPEKHVHIMPKNAIQNFTLSNEKTLTIETLKSTDAGVAFLITDNDKCYYHAGDLNLWTWEGESKQYNHNMTSNYLKELEKLKNKRIDIAFVPLDPRQGKESFSGMESFLEYTDSKCVFPMHFWGDFDIASRFLAKHPEHKDKIMLICQNGQVFIVN